jgi:hypothetical protein
MELREAASSIGSHGLSDKDFWQSGVFDSAIERLRGQRAASMETKRRFVASVLNYLKEKRQIADWSYTGSGERYDYELGFPDGGVGIIETKGCLDGNNTNIFERPPNADEFIIWSLCQNAGADPRHNAWSGLHTRLSAEIVSRRQRVDSVVIWDMLCGTVGRPCPKTAGRPERFTGIAGYNVPPPCIYLFPRTIPDPRNNPNPPTWSREDLRFVRALSNAFNTETSDFVTVSIETRMNDAYVQRKTSYSRDSKIEAQSRWTTLRRAR